MLFLFYLVPSDLIKSVSLTSTKEPLILAVGSSAWFICTVTLTTDVSEAMVEFDYGFQMNLASISSGTSQLNSATISSMSLSSAGNYTCKVTVTASGVCGGGGSEPACPTKTSDPVSLTMQCEWEGVYVSLFTCCFIA